MALAKLVNKPAPEKVEVPQVGKAYLNRKQKQQDVYYKEYNDHQHEKKDWDEFNKVDTKL